MTEEEGAVYGRLQDAWLEMCTTYLEMVGDLSNSSKETRTGQEWEGEESLAGILGQLDREGGGDTKSASTRDIPVAYTDDKEEEDTSCEVEVREISSSEKTTEEATGLASDGTAENANVPSPLCEEGEEMCNEAKHEDDLEGETQGKPDIEDIVDARNVPEKDDTLTDENGDPIKLEVEQLAVEASDLELEVEQLAVEASDLELEAEQLAVEASDEDEMGKGRAPTKDTTNKGEEEEEVDIMSENDKVVRENVEKDKTESEVNINKEEDVEKQSDVTAGDDVIEDKNTSEKCDIQVTDVPNNEGGENEKEDNSVEHIIEDKTENTCMSAESESGEKDQPEAPFSFSDFARQPNRPDSPNMSEGSDPGEEEGGGGGEKSELQGKKSEESQNENGESGSPVKKEVKID